jgi:hypothetical protein
MSSVDALIPTERHPACWQREARSGCRMERENLAGDAKGKGTSGSNCEAESTDAPERGGPPRSSVEAGKPRHHRQPSHAVDLFAIADAAVIFTRRLVAHAKIAARGPQATVRR